MSTKDTVDAENAFRKKFGRLSLGVDLKALRLSEFVSQTDFAAKLGVSPQYLCDRETGRKLISIAKAADFAKKIRQPQIVFITLAIQDELDKYRLPYTVTLIEKKRRNHN